MKRYTIWPWLVWMVLGASWWWAVGWATTRLIAPPPALVPIPLAPSPRPLTTPLAKRVVMVVLSGVGAQTLNDPANPFAFRTLRRLAAEGAWGISNTAVPSGDMPTWTALLTGAPPRISGVASERTSPYTLDSLLTHIDPWTIIGSQRALTSRGIMPTMRQVHAIASSDGVAAAARTTLQSRQDQLVIVVLDLARREQYSGSQLWERVDAQLDTVVGVLDPLQDSLIVTADHGLLPDGSFGGTEPVVTQTPLVLWGAGIVPGPLGALQQVDLAPTVALLLRTPLPAASTGWPRFEALHLAPQAQARAHLAWLDQQVALQQHTVSNQVLPPAVAAARTAFTQGNWATAANGAEAAVQALTTGAASPTFVGSLYLWSIGLPLVLLVGARLLARWGRRLAHFLTLPVLGLELYLLAWSAIFFGLAGRSISLSALYNNPGGQLLSIGGWAVLALVVAALPLAWLATGRGPTFALHQVSRLVGLLQLVGAVLAATIILAVRQPLAQTGAWAGLLIVLAQLAALGLAAPAVGLFAAALTDVFERGR